MPATLTPPTAMEEIFATIEAYTDENLALLERACAQPSISARKEGLDEMANLVAGILRDTGFKVELVPAGDAAVVLGLLTGSSERTVIFYNHYDVQPPDPLEEWTTPPFEPDIREGRFYARGASDNKGAIVSRACALQAYLAHRGELPVNIVWVVEGEEEIGSPHLDQFVAQHKHLLHSAYGCVWEGGGKNAHDRFEIALGCKGLLYVELRAQEAARDLHSALAAIVPNPVWRMVWALSTLKGPDEHVQIPGFYDEVRPISSAQRETLAAWDYPEEQTRMLYGLDGFIAGLSGQPLRERLIFGPTCNIDGFHAGYGGPGSKTVLPHKASAKLDFRLVPDQDPNTILALLRAHLDAAGFSDIEIVASDGEPPSAGDPMHPFVKIAAQTAESIYGHRPALIPMMSGTGPVYVLCGQFGVPMITAGVGYAGSRAHAPDEHITVADFVAGTKYIAMLMEALSDVENTTG
jgi:acetylornithine deacetylase/succinyl-diaminopimelate desuccinylase-like protein